MKSGWKRDNDLAIALCHFNWCGFYTPTRNLHRFIRQMEIQDIPVYGVELSLDGNFETKDIPNWKHITATRENICFQKEACINIAVGMMPSDITKVAWIDHDFLFTNPNWYEEVSVKLDTHKAVQLFSEYISTDIFGRQIKSTISTAKSHAMYGKKANARGCAWAARRELWNKGGLYPLSFLGGGDSLFASTVLRFLDQRIQNVCGLYGNQNFDPFIKWKESIENYITPSDVSYIEGRIIHEWHGHQDDRKYPTRYDIAKGMDLSKILSLGSNGLVQISNVPDEFYNKVLTYFKDRNEDGVGNKL